MLYVIKTVCKLRVAAVFFDRASVFSLLLMDVICEKINEVSGVEMNIAKNTYPTADLFKFICAILIIGVHTEPFAFNYWLDKGFGLITRLAVPYFFVASSYFLFRNMNFTDPVNFSIKPIIRRIAVLYGMWSLIYLPLRIFTWLKTDANMGGIIIEYIGDIFIYGTYSHLWFMPALILGVVLVYVLLRVFKMKSILAVSIVILSIGIMFSTYFPLTKKVLSVWHLSLPFLDSEMSIFRTFPGLFYGFPYVSLGALLASQHKEILEKDNMGKWILWFSISMMVLALESLIAFKLVGSKSTILWFSQLPATAFLFIISLKSKMFIESSLSILLRKMSILIYTSHLLFYRLFEALFIQSSSETFYQPMFFVAILTAAIIFSLGIIKLSTKWKVFKLLY
jgi:serine/alanine racemase